MNKTGGRRVNHRCSIIAYEIGVVFRAKEIDSLPVDWEDFHLLNQAKDSQDHRRDQLNQSFEY